MFTSLDIWYKHKRKYTHNTYDYMSETGTA